MKFATTLFCLLALPVVTIAQGPTPKPKSSITLAVPGLNCTTASGAGTFAVQSYSWGASNPVAIGGGGSGSGNVSISSLNITKQFDSCSPVLFDTVSQGTFFKLLTLTQRNADGDPVSIIGLESVRVESWQVSSSINEASATESVSFAAQKFCVTDVASGNKFCYDVALQKVF